MRYIVLILLLIICSCCSTSKMRDRGFEEIQTEETQVEEPMEDVSASINFEDEEIIEEAVFDEEGWEIEKKTIEKEETLTEQKNRVRSKKPKQVKQKQIKPKQVETEEMTIPIIEEDNIGDVSYNVEDTMFVGISKTIELVISKNMEISTVVEEIPSFNIQTQTEDIRTSKLMVVKLINPSDENFKIVLTTDEKQVVEKKGLTRWIWEVTPLIPGQHKLKLSIAIEIDGNSKTEKVYENFINVISTDTFGSKLKNWFMSYWQWIISSLILPFILVIFKERKSKK